MGEGDKLEYFSPPELCKHVGEGMVGEAKA